MRFIGPYDSSDVHTMDEIYAYALRLLQRRDYSVARLNEKLHDRFGEVPDEVIAQLLKKNFLNDRRFAEAYTARRKHRGREFVREELLGHGVDAGLVDRALSRAEWPSLRDAVTAKMKRLNLRAPLQPRDAARLFRALLRLGYDEDAIREQIEKL
jgi:SOS response regulatory protein OraA/RecX